MLRLGAVWRLGASSFLAQSAFTIYGATLPLYFAALGFEPWLIGLLIGAAGIAQLFGALAVGPGIDRFGPRVVLLGGAACHVVASLGYAAFTAVPMLSVLRLVQGLGQAAAVPATYAFVPLLARRAGETTAFATLGIAGSLALAVWPPLGLGLLQNSGPPALFLTAAMIAVVAGLVLTSVPAPTASQRPLGLAFRRAWSMPLLVTVLSFAQWGVIQAFVPLAASETGSNPALLFTADAICVLAARIPAGWLADRYGLRRLALIGVATMTLSPSVLLLPLSDTVLIVAGLLNGTGAALTLPPLLAELSRRSDEATRGTSLAFFSVASAVGLIVGASGGGLAYPWLGFHGLLSAGALACAAGVVALLADAPQRSRHEA
jgi:MFS family permease